MSTPPQTRPQTRPETAPPLRVAVIVASTREGRFCPTAARWFAGVASRRTDVEVDMIDLADEPLPTVLIGGSDLPAAVDDLSRRLAAADGFVVVTPEYNHSFPASLKNAIDWFHSEWSAKPVAFVSYGGMSGGLRSVEQLRLVFAELHAVTVRDTVSFHNYWSLFDDDGQLHEPKSAETAAAGMLDQLVWWGDALRAARAERPYVAA